jgi:hypothetical protein
MLATAAITLHYNSYLCAILRLPLSTFVLRDSFNFATSAYKSQGNLTVVYTPTTFTQPFAHLPACPFRSRPENISCPLLNINYDLINLI